MPPLRYSLKGKDNSKFVSSDTMVHCSSTAKYSLTANTITYAIYCHCYCHFISCQSFTCIQRKMTNYVLHSNIGNLMITQKKMFRSKKSCRHRALSYSWIMIKDFRIGIGGDPIGFKLVRFRPILSKRNQSRIGNFLKKIRFRFWFDLVPTDESGRFGPILL